MHALAKLIRECMDHDASLTHAKIAELGGGDTGMRGTVGALANPKKDSLDAVPRPRTLQVLARGLGVPLRRVVLAAVEAAGLDISDPADTAFAKRVPRAVNDLPKEAQDNLIDIIKSTIKAYAPTEPLGAEDERLIAEHSRTQADVDLLRGRFRTINADPEITPRDREKIKKLLVSDQF